MKNLTQFLFKSGLLLLVLFAFSAKAQTVNETFISGAYIIDMSQPTTSNNNLRVAQGLKPYGLVYTLIKDHNVPVRWAINPTKLKDGTDFTVNAKNYMGGSFIIPAQYASAAVISAINLAKAAGVIVDGPINTSFTAPIYSELSSWPRAVLDEDNGSIVAKYYTNAGVPTSSYVLKGNPTMLTGCDDIYVLPHADPQKWVASWKTALDNYVTSGGYLWSACHAVSAVEAAPVGSTQYLNFNYLSSTGLIPWGSHNDGSGIYTYNPAYAADPIMQFIGSLDAATTNGSEQIYIPTKTTGSWRPTTKVAVYQPVHTQANPNEAAVLVYGPAYGNSNYGMVMYLGGHNHDGTSAAHVSAQRAYFNFLLMSGVQKQPEVITNIPSTVYSGEVLNLSASVVNGTGPFTYAWSSSCAGGSFTNANSANATYTAPVVNTITDCIITVIVTDNCGRFSIASETVVVMPPQADLMVLKTVSDATPAVGSNITFTISATNNGQNDATGVVVNDVLPSGYSFVSATPSTGTWNAPNWNIGNLAINANATLSIVATVLPTGNYANTATISGTLTDPNPNNNSSTSTPVPVFITDLAVTKTVSNQTPNVGEIVTFTVTATNNGPSGATGVNVNDALPTGYTLVSATPSSGTWTAPNWVVGNLANGGSATLSILATVLGTGSYANTAIISGNQTDPTPGNNTATSTPVPVAISDLAVVKTVNNQTPNIGSNVTFTIAATNNGPSPATGVNVNDVLPAGYTLVTATPSTGTWTAPNWSVGDLANGATANLIIVATVNASGPYANTATISGDQTDPTSGNNSSTSTPVPVSVADLAVAKTVSNPTPPIGTQVTFTITATNNGPSNATGVNVSDALPSGYTFVSANPSIGTWSGNNWTIGNLGNGSSATLSIVATVNASGSYANTATISGAETDLVPGNNSSTVTPIPTAVADLSILKSVNNQTPVVGTNVTFTLLATNNGPSTATGIIVNDVLPAGYTFVSAFTSTGNWTAPNWSIPSLSSGDNATLSIVATVNATGPYGNTASITGAQPDPVSGNNSSTVTPVPSAVTDLAITKTVNNQTPNVGSNVTFLITATNNGPSGATGVTVNDVLPAGYAFVSANPSTGTWTAPNWVVGSLANGGSATLSIVATVLGAGPYANTATISGNQTDPTPGNNSSTSTPVPTAISDLAITKTVSNQTPYTGSNVTFTITATNNGPSNATGVSVLDALPAGYTLVSGNPSTGTWLSPNWTIGSLTNGASASLTIVATVNASGPYANTASIGGDQTDPTPGNNSSTSTPVPVAAADLAITKSVSNQTPVIGSNVTFTLVATNNGPSTATGIIVNDVLPAGYTFVNASASAGTWSAPNWSIPSLLNGANATLTIIATVNASGPYGNTASITGTQPDPVSGNNSSTVTPVPLASADLSVNKTVNISSPAVGTNVVFTITASNSGPSNATGVTVIDALPAGYVLVSANPSSGTWSAPNWTIGNLNNGASVTMQIVATVLAAGPYQNTATISGNENDPNQANNTSSVSPLVGSLTDLAITKTISNATPNVGTSVTFTITATNNGPSPATGVIVNDMLPNGYTFSSASASIGSWNAPVWTIGNLASGGSGNLIIVATVNASGSYANTASITGNESDPNLDNNSATVTPQIGAVADLAVLKTISNSTPTVGTSVTFTITATNNGPSNASGVSVLDVLPAGYTFESANPSTGTWSAPNWIIGNLNNGASVTMQIVATVLASGPYQNTAIISGNEFDPNGANNTSSITPVVGSVADLAITKTISNTSPNVGTSVTFTITATNNGPSPATGVVVTDMLPNGYTFSSASASIGSWNAPVWTIGNLASGGTGNLIIVATVNASGPYANTASITGNESDPNLVNNSATVSPQIGSLADLAVVKTANLQNPSVGNNITFTIVASNNGPSAATGVTVNDVLPSGYTLFSATTNNGSWTDPNWTIGNLASGGVATLNIVATVNSGGNYANTATISGNESDPNTDNNSSTSTPVPGPNAVNDNASTTLNTPVNIIILGNDLTGASPLNPGSITFVPGTTPPASEGVFTVNPTTGVVTFTPAVGFTGTSTVNYQVCDMNSLCDVATIIVVVNTVAGPTANDDNATTTLNTAVNINILENDVPGATPINPASVTFVPGTLPNPTTQGTFTVNASTGLVTFTPVTGFTGTVTVDYQVCDQNALCDIATITVIINTVAGPTANDDNATTNLNTPVDINVLANDVAGATPIVPSSVTFVNGTAPNPTTQGTFTVNATTGLVTFTPVTGFTGTVTVDYQVCDQNALCDIATITVIINTVAGPTANDDSATTNLNTPVDINVLANDVAGATPLNPASVTFVPGTLPNPTTEGTFTANATTGLVTFTPVTGFTGTATIDYQVCDQNVLCDIAKITVTINTVAGPDARNDNATTLINTPTTIDILANDIQGVAALDPTSVTFIVGTQPNPSTQGTFTVDPTTGLVTFTPANGFIGTATINYQVCDLNGLCDIATITVNVILGTGNLYPALGPGTLAFEDLWPGKGDYDFNDLVIDYQFEIISNASNFVEQVTATFVIRAFGASFENGFGFQLSEAINAADLNVTGFDLSENFITLSANGTEAGQSKPTIIVFDNAFAQMPHPGIGIGVNTEPNAPYVQPVTLTVNIDFKPNTYSFNQLDISNFNPFLIVNKNRSHEVHLPNYPPTDLVDMSLFGQWEDASNPATGKYYVTDNNLPWAINIYERFDYPIEKQEILWVHLKFAEWAMSGGVQFPDWYKNLTGYRNNSLIYQVPAK
jgi:LruC domain-containing protein/uncharacterized repeat protein (TIGR01451 family)